MLSQNVCLSILFIGGIRVFVGVTKFYVIGDKRRTLALRAFF